MVSSMYNEGRNILLIVEGADDEVNLFNKIIHCFPEIRLSPENILVYNTNMWALNDELTGSFGDDWYDSEDIEFREFLESKFPDIRGKKITDTYLVFDYERQDDRFAPQKIENMCKFFNDSTENGQLYINYPMIESYRHLNVKPLPDEGFKDRICNVQELKQYKSTVGVETKYHDYRKYEKTHMQQIIIHNLKKISYILGDEYDLEEGQLLSLAEQINHVDIVKKQNELSKADDGYVYVLCTCVMFVTDYNPKLLMET